MTLIFLLFIFFVIEAKYHKIVFEGKKVLQVNLKKKWLVCRLACTCTHVSQHLSRGNTSFYWIIVQVNRLQYYIRWCFDFDFIKPNSVWLFNSLLRIFNQVRITIKFDRIYVDSWYLTVFLYFECETWSTLEEI